MFLRYLKVNPVFFGWDRETLDTQTALLEEKYEGKIANLQMNLKRFYSEELKVRASCELLFIISQHYGLN